MMPRDVRFFSGSRLLCAMLQSPALSLKNVDCLVRYVYGPSGYELVPLRRAVLEDFRGIRR